jgi:hypothetical protein
MLDAGCYVVTGGAIVAGSSSTAGLPVWAPLVGIAVFLYGIYIYATDGSYWVSSVVYALAIVFLLAGLGMLSQGH